METRWTEIDITPRMGLMKELKDSTHYIGVNGNSMYGSYKVVDEKISLENWDGFIDKRIARSNNHLRRIVRKNKRIAKKVRNRKEVCARLGFALKGMEEYFKEVAENYKSLKRSSGKILKLKRIPNYPALINNNEKQLENDSK